MCDRCTLDWDDDPPDPSEYMDLVGPDCPPPPHLRRAWEARR